MHKTGIREISTFGSRANVCFRYITMKRVFDREVSTVQSDTFGALFRERYLLQTAFSRFDVNF